jgi:hypothetical protein
MRGPLASGGSHEYDVVLFRVRDCRDNHKGDDVMWTTEDEMKFLEKIGDHAAPIQVRTYKRRFILLHRYKDAMKVRINWGEIDSGEILCYVLDRIRWEEELWGMR